MYFCFYGTQLTVKLTHLTVQRAGTWGALPEGSCVV